MSIHSRIYLLSVCLSAEIRTQRILILKIVVATVTQKVKMLQKQTDPEITQKQFDETWYVNRWQSANYAGLFMLPTYKNYGC